MAAPAVLIAQFRGFFISSEFERLHPPVNATS